MKSRDSLSFIRAAALLAPTALSGLGHAQESYRDIPTHAHYSATEQGWTCDDGFRQAAGYCLREAQETPSQSALEFFDGQWRCRSGYRRTNGLCVPLTAPAHATLVGEGDRWECDWGFKKVASRCEEIVPPAHAYVDASGHDWVCYPHFERRADQCVATLNSEAAAGGTPSAEGTPGAAQEGESKSTPEPQADGGP